ncbi:MAG: calcium/sodium antiporter [Anaerolineae bacterium]
MGFNILLVIAGLAGLYFGGEWLVTGASRMALRFNVPAIVIGLTVVAVGTSAPELFVSVQAALGGQEGISLGNVIGSNIANIGLILGLAGAISVVSVQRSLVKREIPILIVITLATIATTLDGEISRLEGALLLLGFVAFNVYFYYLAQHDTEVKIEAPDPDKLEPEDTHITVDLMYIVSGIALLVIGSRLMVIGATAVAQALGVSELVIGITVVAFGTSLPELATSITAIIKKEDDIAIGNVIGSNVANLLLVLGTTASIRAIDITASDLSAVEYVVMIGFTLLLLPFARNRSLSRLESALFLGAYFAFIAYSFLSAGG